MADRTRITGVTLLDPEQNGPLGKDLLIQAGEIEAQLGAGEALQFPSSELNLQGCYLAPGLIDLHDHGSIPFDTDDVLGASLTRQSGDRLRHGVTAFLPTSVAWRVKELQSKLGMLALTLESGDFPGACPLGVHLEGPWISAQAAGAQPASSIRGYDATEGASIFDAARGWVRMVTFAPEELGTNQLLDDLVRHRIVPSIGHSLALPDQIKRAAGEGARHSTHLFNAMGPLHQRDCSTAISILNHDALSCDLICDGQHVDPAWIKLAHSMKGSQLSLITDRIDIEASASATGFGSGEIMEKNGALYLSDGRLAGSCLQMDQALANFRQFAQVDLIEAVRACTLSPARLLGIEARHGSLRVGARADFIVLSQEGRLLQTWIAGKKVYEAEPAAA